MTYKELVDKVKNGEPFSFSRMGDGEWSAIIGKSGFNCDKHEYFKSLGNNLRIILESKPDYYLGMQSLAKRVFSDHPEFKRLESINEWVEADCIHRHNEKNGLYDLFDILKTREVVLVGHEDMAKMNKYFGISDFIEIPRVNAWLEAWDISRRLHEVNSDGKIFLYCASMLSNVLIHYHKDRKNIQQIDIGSAFSPYIGENIRSYHSKVLVK